MDARWWECLIAEDGGLPEDNEYGRFYHWPTGEWLETEKGMASWELYIGGRWQYVTYYIWRSATWPRRVNKMIWHGPHYYLGTNQIVTLARARA